MWIVGHVGISPRYPRIHHTVGWDMLDVGYTWCGYKDMLGFPKVSYDTPHCGLGHVGLGYTWCDTLGFPEVSYDTPHCRLGHVGLGYTWCGYEDTLEFPKVYPTVHHTVGWDMLG